MNTLLREAMTMEPSQLAHHFISTFTHDKDAAIEHLHNHLDSMETAKFHECIDHLGSLLISNKSPDEAWEAVFGVLRAL